MNRKRSDMELMWVELTPANNRIPYEPKRKCTLETKLNSKIKVSCRRPTLKTLKQIKQYADKNMEFLNCIETMNLRDCSMLLGEVQEIMQLCGVKVTSQDICEAAEKNLKESDKADNIFDSMHEVFKEFDNYSPAAALKDNNNNKVEEAGENDKLYKFEDTSWLFLRLKIENIVVASVFVFRGSKGFWELGEERLAGMLFVRDGIYVPRSLGFQSITTSVPFMLCKILFPEHQHVSVNGLFIPWIIKYAQKCKVSRIYANPLSRQLEILQKHYGFKKLEEQKDNLVFRHHTFKDFSGMPPTVTYVLSESLSKYMISSIGYDSGNLTEDHFDHLIGLTYEWYDSDDESDDDDEN